MARDAILPLGTGSVHRRSVNNNNKSTSHELRKSVVAPEANHEPHYYDDDKRVANPEADAPEETSPPPTKHRPSYSRPYDLPPPKAPLPKRCVATSEKSKADDEVPSSVVNAHSRTLLEMKRRKPSLVDPSLKVEDRLQQLGLVYAQKQASKQAVHETTQCTFSPAISYHSSKLSRHGSVHDRLYGLAKAPNRAADSTTHASPAKPLPSSTAISTSVGDRLYRKAREFQTKQAAIRAAEAAEAAQLRNARKMSAKSLRLVERTKPPATTSTVSPPARAKQVTPAEARAIYERQLQWKEAKDARSARMRWQQDQDEQQACTFQNPYADISTPPPSHDASFFHKAIEWAKAKDALVRQKQQARQADELAACPFKPQRPARPRRRDMSSLEAIVATFQAEHYAHAPLPYPWEAYTDALGNDYYYNPATKTTQWGRPT
ncbi:hypothetical protein SPRG_02954 [Saprolegnia parasitica CBS 223.65]|uniref:WW domain-containing protein n=1 Tax=Saprolegnia parasitica (strain CBS 223.65) TaxID=695850 RepID=A0A067D098_SAPPC|nr:hypothetical protein SPRG_02954 [Saprolegnia parasitica CBS 223.65]KDO32477.1 hypothetical protein SPRG_02954 [Saprolegnia parasitica CBS 223.65]|eukprot:XP_012196928.1 hypothetical protein SPRG_02954 [Saprolegnia parasitica CBS 223.65]